MGTTKNGLWKSTDYGASWKQVSSFPQNNINFVLFDPQAALWVRKHCAFLLRRSIQTDKVFTAVMMVAALGCLFSINRRALWQSEPRLLTRFFLSPLQMLKGQMALQMALSGNLMFLKKHGRTFLHRRFVRFSGISVYHSNPKYIVVSTLDRWTLSDEIYFSTDGGNSWSLRLSNAKLNHSFAPYTSGNIKPHWIASVAMDPFDSSKIMFGTGYGIWQQTILMQLFRHGT